MHVLEKLWKAAYVFHPEGSLEADLWVIDHTLRILFRDVGQVIKDLRQTTTQRGWAGPKRKTLESVALFLYRNRTRMRYNDYLAQGVADCQGPGRRRLQEPDQRPNGALRHALDRANGGGIIP